MVDRKFHTIMDEMYAFYVIREVKEIEKYDREKNEN